MSHSVPSTLYPRINRAARGFAKGWNRVGEQTQFYARTIGAVGDVLMNYRLEMLRLIAQMSLGVGALLMVGGSVVVIGFLTAAAGSLVAVQGYGALSGIGIEALIGFFSAYFNTRLAGPLIATVGLSATIGAGATAQLGAMRINEEIDALEVIGVRSVAYLASTRLVAGVIVVIPLYCAAAVMAFLGSRASIALYGQSSGVYNHYFNTFLVSSDLIWSFLIVLCSGTVVMLIHTYYGYNASGGPAGVGEAVGRAVRTSLVFAVIVILCVSLAIYGPTGNFHLSD
ncbi:ABC transporter permease [Mycobacterium paraseoulense]|uniref:ABC transporter permease n=1 Tax=Mycobacterium paraseoulense TaxID=590652 RepID=A0A1X0I913_9MYCO|nr:ABC transporter permease [Mycobacterium paraseoulense]MCV7393946.1 ABC transporter permease [Mycobacterium paraseoulense]ORB38383.1 ABC transporter permease [Mycobacterium paraseoulense]BBZ70425.1 ABC transporter permease [Mycobacterium paraseoulense]